MTKTTLYLVLLSLLFTSDLEALNTPISFQKLSFSEAQSKANLEKKHFFAYFYGDWCLGCQVMEESTFTDQKLVSYIHDEFLAVKVDIHSALGKEWDKEFQISGMPTFLIFDPYGHLINRYESTFTSSSLYQALHQSINPDLTRQEDKSLALWCSPNDLPKVNIDTGDQQLTNQLIKQLESLMLQNEQHVDHTALKNDDLIQLRPEAQGVSPIHQSIIQIVNAEGDSTLQITEADCQQILSDPKQLQILISALKATRPATNNTATNKEVVVAAMVPMERPTETKVNANNTSTVKKMYSNGSHKIQLGQYNDYHKAAAFVKEIKTKFEKEAFLLIDKKGRYRTYRVLVSGFENQKEASDFLLALKELGYSF